MRCQTIPAINWATLAGKSEIVFGKWEKQGVVIKNDQSWEKDRNLSIFPSTILDCGSVRRFYYSLNSCKDDGYTLALAEQDKKTGEIKKSPLVSNGKGYFSLSGISEELMPIQANVFQLEQNYWRMYFWAHFHGSPRTVKMMVAHSEDGLQWQIANAGEPILRHPSDAECAAARWPYHLRCNDATAIYQNSDNSWEIFSAALVTLDPRNKRFSDKGTWCGFIRIIQRWTSPDGLNWSEPEIVAAPDADDPADLQFYYLLKTQLDWGSLGLLGRFYVQTQRLTIEPVSSTDNRFWRRPLRKNCLPQDEAFESVSVIPAHTLLQEGNYLRLYYNGSNFDHNFKTPDGARPQQVIASATIHRNRTWGLNLRDDVILSPRLRLTQNELILHADIESLQIQWVDIFTAESLTDMQAITNSAATISIAVPEKIRGNAARLKITGKGVIYDLCQMSKNCSGNCAI